MTDLAKRCVQQGKGEILDDIAGGIVPASVDTFAELHDYVDANEYGGLCDLADAELDAGADSTSEGLQSLAIEVQDTLDRWLRAGRPLEG